MQPNYNNPHSTIGYHSIWHRKAVINNRNTGGPLLGQTTGHTTGHTVTHGVGSSNIGVIPAAGTRYGEVRTTAPVVATTSNVVHQPVVATTAHQAVHAAPVTRESRVQKTIGTRVERVEKTELGEYERPRYDKVHSSMVEQKMLAPTDIPPAKSKCPKFLMPLCCCCGLLLALLGMLLGLGILGGGIDVDGGFGLFSSSTSTSTSSRTGTETETNTETNTQTSVSVSESESASINTAIIAGIGGTAGAAGAAAILGNLASGGLSGDEKYTVIREEMILNKTG